MIKQENQITQFIQAALEKELYPNELSKEWRLAAVRALDFTSPLREGIKPQEMLDIRNKLMENQPLNCLEYATASNNLQARSREELNMGVSEYYNLMNDTAEEAELFNSFTKPIYDKAVGDALTAGREQKQYGPGEGPELGKLLPIAPIAEA